MALRIILTHDSIYSEQLKAMKLPHQSDRPLTRKVIAMKDLAVIREGTAIVANTVSTVKTLVAYSDTGPNRKRRNKMIYSLQTQNIGVQAIEFFGFEGRARDRAEAIVEAAFFGDRNDILST